MKKEIPALTALRFFAALWVLLYHLCHHFGCELPRGIAHFIQGGPLAMTFFFVLSGFILVVASNGEEPWNNYGRYAWRRFARIYPLYGFFLITYWATIGFVAEYKETSWMSLVSLLISDVTLAGAWFPQAFLGGFGRDGTWSLSVELFCYALFPMLLFVSRKMECKDLRRAYICMIGLAALGPTMGRYVPPPGPGR